MAFGHCGNLNSRQEEKGLVSIIAPHQIVGRPIVRDAIQNQIRQQNSKGWGRTWKTGTLALLVCISYLSQSCDQISDKSGLKKEGVVWLRVHRGEKTWYPECQVARRSASAGSVER